MKRVLIIEDDQVVANIYRSRFQSEGWTVEVALDGESGLELFRNFKPQVVLLDLILPALNGVEVLKRIRAEPKNAQLPVIVFSNTYLANMVQQAWKAGATKCLSKASTSPRQLTDSVRSALENALAPSETSAPGTAAEERRETPAVAVRAFGSASPDEARQAFIAALPPTMATIRESLKRLMKASAEPVRLQELQELSRRVRAITGSSAAGGFHQVARMSDALEALLQDLHQTPRNINASTLRTLALAADAIGALFERGLESSSLQELSANILVVDDEAISRRAITCALEKARLKCVTVDDPRMADTLLANSAFDLVFLDVDMPGMNGFELCSRLRGFAKNQSTPVVFVTGLNDLESRAQSMMSGGNDFIGKPFLLMELAVKALMYVLCSKRHPPQPETNPAETPA